MAQPGRNYPPRRDILHQLRDRTEARRKDDISSLTLAEGSGGGFTHVLNADGSAHSVGDTGVNTTLRADGDEPQDPESLYDQSTGVYSVPEAGWYLLSAGIYVENVEGRFYFDSPRATTGLPGSSQHFGPDGDFSLAELLWIDSAGPLDLEANWTATVAGAGVIMVRHLGIGMLR